jgi:hypothetical protein
MLQQPDKFDPESNSRERIDQRINARIARLLADPNAEKEYTRIFLDGPFRSYAHAMAEFAKRNADPDQVASSLMFLMLNMVNELGMAVIGADRPDERADMGRMFFQRLREQWDEVVEQGMIATAQTDEAIRKQTH